MERLGRSQHRATTPSVRKMYPTSMKKPVITRNRHLSGTAEKAV
jgi:hypothetical protein